MTDSSRGQFTTAHVANENQRPVINNIFDFSAEALGQLKTWLEGAGLAIPITQVLGFSQLTQTVLVAKSAAQTLATTTLTTLSWDTEVYDKPDNLMHDNTTNNSRLKARVAGRYLASCIVEWDVNATGSRQTRLYVNGVDTFLANTQAVTAAATETVHAVVFPPIDMALNDYVEVVAAQTSGGNLNVLSTYSRFGLSRIA